MDQPAGVAELTRVLAIGIDAAEPTLVRELIERNQLPTMRRLLEAGHWSRVESPAAIGSGAVWPTFITGTTPRQHGVYSEWLWRPEAMGMRRYSGSGLTPFWKVAAAAGTRVGVLDIPFAPFVGLVDGFEICEWGAHDKLEGRTRMAPASLSARVPPHPFAAQGFDFAACLSGARARGALGARLLRERRPHLAILVFTEVHHAAHPLWRDPALVQLLGEVDAQIATLIEAAHDSAVLVFSLHGMRAARGLTTLLEGLLIERGFARPADWWSQSWRERARSLFASAKRGAPRSLKALYYKTLPQSATHRLAQPTMIPAYDWPRTRAFSLPTDQHGWIRINLLGREENGLVKPRDYEPTCRELELLLRDLENEEGQPVVETIIRTSRDAEDALTQPLPDLVVHWSDAAAASPPPGKRWTGQHAPEGFLIAPKASTTADWVQAEDLHRLFAALHG